MARTNLGDDISYGRTKAVEGVARTYHVQLVCPDDVLCVGALSSAAWILQWAFSGGGFPEPDTDAIVQGLVGMVKRVDKEEKERAAFDRTVAEQQERAEAKRLAKERAEREPWTVVPDDMVDQWAEGREDLD
jgi:cyclopropane fatty-acyl-phospholipid synthase-like methyltransferase